MPKAPVIIWFRRDLRLADNPALLAAVETGAPVIALYIQDEVNLRALGGASKWWLHHSLAALIDKLGALGVMLHIFSGNAQIILPELAQKTGATHVFWNRRYAKDARDTDEAIKSELKTAGVVAKSFKANLLSEPWERQTGSGGYYKVFTPYWKACLAEGPPPKPLSAPLEISGFKGEIGGMALRDLALLPRAPNWAAAFCRTWTPGEAGALARLDAFLDGPVESYAQERNRPDHEGTSRLSPHLAFGEISPRQIWHASKARAKDDAVFLSEIGWREFSYTLLYYNPKLARENFKPAFDNFAWSPNSDDLLAWQRGQTGYPFVDAGMRQLWQTGWQHNRVRMVTGSFLIKHILQDWRGGEDWFWDTLLDADPASNAASWQWVAGSGADASPYFRIFNPFTQGEKFDPEGDYVRRYVPELARLPAKYIHRPWEAPAHVLAQAGVKLGTTYPRPIVDHGLARARALDAYKASRNETDEG